MSSYDDEEDDETTEDDGVLDIIKSDAKRAATRVAARKITKAVQSLIVSRLVSGTKKKDRAKVEEVLKGLLESEEGRSVIGLVIGSLLPYLKSIDALSDHEEVIDSVSEEFRVEGFSVIGEKLIEQATPLLSMLTSEIGSMATLFKGQENNLIKDDSVKYRVSRETESPKEEELIGDEQAEAKVATKHRSHKAARNV